MDPKPNLDLLVQQSLDKCLSRISRISTGHWRTAMVNSSIGKPSSVFARYAADVTEAVFLKLNGLPLSSIMIVTPGDIQCVSRGFTGHSFPKAEKTSIADEIMLTELGNILLNALLNAVINALAQSGLPELPRFIEGDAQKLTSEFGAALNLEEDCRIISAAITLECEGLATWTLHAFVPNELARKIEQA
jgi:hypothetical protein